MPEYTLPSDLAAVAAALSQRAEWERQPAKACDEDDDFEALNKQWHLGRASAFQDAAMAIVKQFGEGK